MATARFLINLEDLGHKWGWFLVLGILLILLGIAALVYTPAATLASVLILGWLMFFSGIVEAIYAFQGRGWAGVLLHVASGALGIFIGLLVVTHPVAGALAWTLLFAAFFTVIGLFRVVGAVWLRYQSWGWAVLDGIVTFILGLLIWAGMPWSGLWFLGFALGITLLLRGWSSVMFAWTVHGIARTLSVRPAV